MKKWRLLLVGFIVLLLAGCGEPYLSTMQPAGEVAKIQFDLLLLSTAIMVLVITTVVLIYVIVLIRFRRTKENENVIPKQVEGSNKLEAIWTIIPIILLIILAIPTLISTFYLGDNRGMHKVNAQGEREAVVVNVRAHQYWWEFEYPDYRIITSQDLVVPTDERVYFNLLASDVKHSFWVPAAGGKLDVNTDNENTFWLVFDSDKAEEVNNIFYGKCAELCGPSHALMDFKVVALPREEFDAWVEAMQNYEVTEPESAVAKEGQQLFEANSCIGCHAITPDDPRPVEARTAPNLADFGNRTTVAGFMEFNKENIKKWLQNPGEYKPGNKMYDHANFTEEELDALAEYLLTLKAQE